MLFLLLCLFLWNYPSGFSCYLYLICNFKKNCFIWLLQIFCMWNSTSSKTWQVHSIMFLLITQKMEVLMIKFILIRKSERIVKAKSKAETSFVWMTSRRQEICWDLPDTVCYCIIKAVKQNLCLALTFPVPTNVCMIC